MSRDNVRDGARLAFGEYVEPQYGFDKAQVVLSLDADFLVIGPGVCATPATSSISAGSSTASTTMNRLYVVESTPTNTGIKADHRLSVRAVDVEAVARAVAAALGVAGAGGGRRCRPGVSAEWIAAVAADLKAHRGTAHRHRRRAAAAGRARARARDERGARQRRRHRPVHARPSRAARTEHLAALADARDDMDAGTVDLLIIVDVNPVYTAPADLALRRAHGEGAAARALTDSSTTRRRCSASGTCR